MSQIVQLLPDKKALELSPRSTLMRPFNVGDWTTLAIGMDFVIPNVTSTESQTTSIPKNRFYFGIKTQGAGYPTDNGETFIGYRITGTMELGSSTIKQLKRSSSSSDMPCAIVNESTYTGSSSTSSTLMGNTINNKTRMILIIRLIDKGLFTQQVKFKLDSETGGIDYSSSLESRMIAVSTTSGSYTNDLTFNTGSTPATIPDSIYLQWPFFNWPLNILEMRVHKDPFV